MSEQYDVVIVGTGHGGAQTAIALRQAGFAGSIALIGDEAELPYERPPLSKDYLAGERPFERLLIRPPHFWSERDIAVETGRRIVAVEPAAHRVIDAGGQTTDYGQLVWATGGRPRRLTCPGADNRHVHYLRTRADVDAIRAVLPGIERAVVIGGGYIGLEAAAVLRKRGIAVVLIEALDRVLARVAGPSLSHFMADRHRHHGVDLRLNAAAAGIDDADAGCSVRLASGEAIPADLVLVGIGIEPAVEPLIAAGAAGDNGVAVDAQCRTSLTDIYAIGDCALHANRWAPGAPIRLESVQNAHDQAAVVARSIAGNARAYDALPWFWSNQYDLKLQTVGLSRGADVEVVRGDPATGSFSIVYGRDGRVIALDCVNATRDYVQGRRLVEQALPFESGRLADAALPLKEM